MTVNSRLYIGLDIGGTKVRAGLMRTTRASLSRIKRLKVIEEKTLRLDRKTALAQTERLITILLKSANDKIQGIGVAAPGPINEQKGLLIKAPNLPGWENLPLGPHLKRRFRVPVVLANDANAAALAEAWWGAGRNKKLIFFATISTGIGTGLVINRRLFRGHTGLALEGGHLSINHTGEICGCGHRGCIEAYASGTSIARRAARLRRGSRLDAAALFKMSQTGARDALRLVQETYEYLGLWLGNIVNLLDPEIIVLGGGVTNWGPPLFRALRRLTPKYSINPNASKIPIVPARLGRDVGVFGAVAALLEKNLNREM